MKWITTLLLVGVCCLTSCKDDSETINPDNGGGDPRIPAGTVEKLMTIDPSVIHQTIRGFGASDCWSPSTVGKLWTSGREGIATLLFSRQIIDGQPQGIGLSQWRVNLGAGTAEQGDASGIEDKPRRAESYMTGKGSIDWNKCEGQRFFMSRAKDMGCENFILFSNSPLVQYTYNGRGYSNRGGTSNLKPEHYSDYAEYMAAVAEHFSGEGYHISHISPVNEPQYNWDGGQEGSGWTNEEVATLARALDGSLTAKGLDTDILLGEAGSYEYLYKSKDDAKRSNVIEAFFQKGSKAYVGDLTHVNQLICGHSYWTDGTWDGMRDIRRKVADKARMKDVELWQSEWSMLGDGYSGSEFVGYDKASMMDIAHYMAKVIHNDLTVANVSSWCYWTSMDVARWGHKNRFLLISLVPEGGEYADLENEGAYAATPTLWVLGNYSLFIHPGYRRIEMTLSESRSFFGSAYISPDGNQIVAVVANLSDRSVSLVETHDKWQGEAKSIRSYTTTGSKCLQEKRIDKNDPIIVEEGSVTTIVFDL